MEITNDRDNIFSTSGADGFLVSRKFSGFLPEPSTSCVEYNKCDYGSQATLDFCTGVCLRTITILTDAATTEGVSLAVIDLDAVPGSSIAILGKLRDGAIAFDRTFTIVLPKGNYQFIFMKKVSNNFVPFWPRYANAVLEAPPQACTNYYDQEDVNFSKLGPHRDECDSLIYNGSFDSSIDGWIVKSSDPTNPAEHYFGTLKTRQRTNVLAHTIKQFIDTTCMVAGDVFSFSATYRNVDENGIDVAACQGAAESQTCVSAVLQRTTFDPSDGTFASSYAVIGRTDVTSGPLFTMSGEWTVTDADVDADRLNIFFNGGTSNLILDNVKLERGI